MLNQSKVNYSIKNLIRCILNNVIIVVFNKTNIMIRLMQLIMEIVMEFSFLNKWIFLIRYEIFIR